MKCFTCGLLALLVAVAPLAAADKDAKQTKPAAKKKAAKKQADKKQAETEKTVVIGAQAPAFQFKDSQGKEFDLAKLTAKGPVLVRLTCGCSGCDKELAYFQELHKAYKEKGLTSVAIFREPDAKVEKYVKSKKLTMLYGIDSKGSSWNIFQTKTMPTNFLIDKGGKIISIAAGCDPSGLLANKVSEKVAGVVKASAVDVKKKVTDGKKQPKKK